MRKRMAGIFMSLVIVLTLIFAIVIQKGMNEAVLHQLKARFSDQARLTRHAFELAYSHQEADQAFPYEAFVETLHRDVDMRITIVGADGTVLADTDEAPNQMDNHLSRDEVWSALSTGSEASSIRYSDTLGTDFLYVAVPLARGETRWVIRVSKPITELRAVNKQVADVALVVILGAAAAALAIIFLASKRLTQPIDALTAAAKEIAAGDYGRRIYGTGKDQIGNLTEAFNAMSTSLAVSVSELKRRNAELEGILNSMINGIVAINEAQQVVVMNGVARELLEIGIHFKAEGTSFYEVVRHEAMGRLVEACFSQRVLQVAEIPYGRSERLLKIYVNPIEDEEGGCIVVIQDITQMRKLEAVRSDFVSNVSHELKTPLTSIRGFVEALKNGAIGDPEKANRFLEIIDIEAERLYRLINDILLLSEIESMKQEGAQNAVSLHSVSGEVLEMLRLKAEQKGLFLEARAHSDAVIYANRDRIKQLIINLVDNAIKYTETGGVTLSTGAEGKNVYIRVSDTGVGFSEAHTDRLFERFYRVDKGRSREQGGTGLGLSIVKHIVMLYGGDIRVESHPGKGTTFEIRFPKKRS